MWVPHSQSEVWNVKNMYVMSHACDQLLLTTAISHAVKEHPGSRPGAILDKGHVVAGVDAEDSKQLHLSSGRGAICAELSGERHVARGTTLSRRVRVNLDPQRKGEM